MNSQVTLGKSGKVNSKSVIVVKKLKQKVEIQA